MTVNEQPLSELVELVRSHKISPWEIDVGKIVNLYAEKLLTDGALDIRTPARVFHSAATLLRIKSAYALNGDKNGQQIPEELEELLEMELPNLGNLTIEYFVPRKLTLDDLLGALRDVVLEPPKQKETSKPQVEKIKLNVSQDMDVQLEAMLDNTMDEIKKRHAQGETVTLLSLVDEKTREKVVTTFLLLLFLCSQDRITLDQPEPFEDILVQPREESADGSERGQKAG